MAEYHMSREDAALWIIGIDPREALRLDLYEIEEMMGDETPEGRLLRASTFLALLTEHHSVLRAAVTELEEAWQKVLEKHLQDAQGHERVASLPTAPHLAPRPSD